MDNNPNHKIETKHKKETTSEHCLVDNTKLAEQDLNENFLNLKNELIFFQDKSKLEEIRANLDEDTNFMKISDEIQPEDVKERGLDFAILVDSSESMYPYRIFLKKALYFALKDVENFCYRALESADDEFPKVRLAFVKYSDRKSKDSEPSSNVEVLDFVEYSSLDEICRRIDSIEINKASVKKRNVFDGLKALSELKWNEDTVKFVLHLAADPQYGIKYTTNPNKMPEDYDPFPDGVNVSEDDVCEPIEALGSTYNFVALTERLLKFQATIQSKLTMDIIAPKVKELQ